MVKYPVSEKISSSTKRILRNAYLGLAGKQADTNRHNLKNNHATNQRCTRS